MIEMHQQYHWKILTLSHKVQCNTMVKRRPLVFRLLSNIPYFVFFLVKLKQQFTHHIIFFDHLFLMESIVKCVWGGKELATLLCGLVASKRVASIASCKFDMNIRHRKRNCVVLEVIAGQTQTFFVFLTVSADDRARATFACRDKRLNVTNNVWIQTYQQFTF